MIQRAGCKPIGADFDPYWWEVRHISYLDFTSKTLPSEEKRYGERGMG